MVIVYSTHTLRAIKRAALIAEFLKLQIQPPHGVHVEYMQNVKNDAPLA